MIAARAKNSRESLLPEPSVYRCKILRRFVEEIEHVAAMDQQVTRWQVDFCMPAVCVAYDGDAGFHILDQPYPQFPGSGRAGPTDRFGGCGRPAFELAASRWRRLPSCRTSAAQRAGCGIEACGPSGSKAAVPVLLIVPVRAEHAAERTGRAHSVERLRALDGA